MRRTQLITLIMAAAIVGTCAAVIWLSAASYRECRRVHPRWYCVAKASR